MKGLQIFQDEQFGWLHYFIDDEGIPGFWAKDIAAAIEYPDLSLCQTNNPLILHVPENCKKRIYSMLVGGPQETLILTERGVYTFLTHSDLPKAQLYWNWLDTKVIPAILSVSDDFVSSDNLEDILTRVVLLANDANNLEARLRQLMPKKSWKH